MKYEYLHEISSDSSLGKFLNQIKPESVVLECGCASGYMTRMLKEKLNCRVYIVEYDREGFENARQYAVDGICADLMSDHWKEKFRSVKFDYIIFADVLEHLSCPLEVLKSAVAMLRDDGAVMVSLPNVGHNDIIIRLLQGHWDYTETGLLDDTHVRFWGIHNLEPFFRDAGLSIAVYDCVTIPTGHTEQYDGTELLLDDAVYSVIRNRPEGEIYQFTLTLRKMDYWMQSRENIVNHFPTAGTQSLQAESLKQLQQRLANQEGHIAQLIRSERELQSEIKCKAGHIEQLLQSERNLQAEVRCKAGHIEQLLQSERDLQSELRFQTETVERLRLSETELLNRLDAAYRRIESLQHKLEAIN